MRYPFLCPGSLAVAIRRSGGTHLTASREERAIPDVPSAPALPVTTHHLPTPTGRSTSSACTPRHPSHHCSARCGTRDEPIDVDMDDVPSQASVPSATVMEWTETPSSPMIKREAPDSHDLQVPRRKRKVDETIQYLLARTDTVAEVVKQEPSSGESVPSSAEPPLVRQGGESEPANPKKKKGPFNCPIPGCFERKPITYGRIQEYYRHICTSVAHDDDRSVPGWEKRWGIPSDYTGGIKYCPYRSCPKRDRKMRRGTTSTNI